MFIWSLLFSGLAWGWTTLMYFTWTRGSGHLSVPVSQQQAQEKEPFILQLSLETIWLFMVRIQKRLHFIILLPPIKRVFFLSFSTRRECTYPLPRGEMLRRGDLLLPPGLPSVGVCWGEVATQWVLDRTLCHFFSTPCSFHIQPVICTV